MPRPLSPRAILEAQRLNSDEVFLTLITILMDGAADGDIRVVNNTEDIVSRGETFLACPFQIVLPDEVDYATTNARIEIDNVDPSIWQGIRALGFAPEVRLEVILASETDVVLISSAGLKLREAIATSTVISGVLVPDTIWQTGYPEGDYDPPQNRGLFT
jgi:hypothetical protein